MAVNEACSQMRYFCIAITLLLVSISVHIDGKCYKCWVVVWALQMQRSQKKHCIRTYPFRSSPASRSHSGSTHVSTTWETHKRQKEDIILLEKGWNTLDISPFLGKKKEILNIKGLINLPRTSIVFLYGLTYFFGSTFSDWSKYCEEAKLARSSYYLVDVSESAHRNSDPRGIRFDLVDNQDHRQRKTQGWIFTLESQAGEGLINLLLSFSVSILPPFLTFSYPSSFFSGNLSLERELHNY